MRNMGSIDGYNRIPGCREYRKGFAIGRVEHRG